MRRVLTLTDDELDLLLDWYGNLESTTVGRPSILHDADEEDDALADKIREVRLK